MARITRTVELPDGSKRQVEVDSDWSTDEVRTKLRAHFGLDEATRQESPVAQADATTSTEPTTPEPAQLAEPEQPDDLPPFVDPVEQTAPKGDSDRVRSFKLGTRNVAEGLASLPLLVGQNFENLVSAAQGEDPTQLAPTFHDMLTDMGLPEAQNAQERVIGRTIEFASEALGGQGIARAGTATAKGAADALARRVKNPFETLATADLAPLLTGAAGAGAAFGAAEEAELHPVVQMAAALAGGVGGASGASAAGTRLARWADARSASGKPVTDAEVQAEALKNEVVLGEAAATELTNAINKVKNTGIVDAAVLDGLNPNLKLGTVPVAQARARFARDDLAREVRDLFDTPEQAKQFVEDAASMKQVEGTRLDNAPIEVRRAADRMGSEANRRIMQQIEDRRQLALSKLDNEQARPAAQPLLDVAENAGKANARAINSDPVIKGNTRTYRNSQGDVPGEQTFGMKTVKLMEQIAPRVAGGVRKASATSNRNTGKAINRMRGFFEDKPIAKALANDMEFRAAVLNRNLDEMERIVKGSASKFESVAAELDRIKEVRRGAGLKTLGDDVDFFPRAVKDLGKLRKQLIKEDGGRQARVSKLDQALKAATEKKGSPLDEQEVAGVVGRMIAGHGVKLDRGRTVANVSPEAAKQYLNPTASIYDAVRRFEDDVTTQNFFQKELGVKADLGQALDKRAIDDHLSSLLVKSLRSGEISAKDVDKLADLIDVHFGVSRGGPTQGQRNAKDIFTALTLGFNPFSTATQIADVGFAGIRFGPLNAIKGLFGKDVANLYESGLRNAAADLRTQHGAAQFTKNALKSFGFDKLDKIGNRTAMNAAYRKRGQQAEKNPAKLQQELTELFGDTDATKIIDDLNANRYSDDVAALMLHDVADIRPVGREDMPINYNRDPHGRVKYSLLSWSINQLNFTRNKAFNDISSGVRSGNVKQIAKGTAALAALTAAFGLANVPAGVTKDLMAGKELDPVGHFSAGMIPFGMTAKFAGDSLMTHDPGSAAAKVVPFVGIVANAIGKGMQAGVNQDIDKVWEMTPTTRNLKKLMDGGLIEGVGGAIGAGANALVSAAQAEPQTVSGALDDRSQAQVEAELRELRGQTQLPEGTFELPPEPTAPAPEDVAAQVEQDAQQQLEPLPPEATVEDRVRTHLEQREGNVSQSYTDTEGNLTGGIGHLMTPAEQAKYPEGTEIPQEVRDTWYEKDSKKALNAAKLQAKVLDEPRLVPVLTSVNFQLGTEWFKEHKNTWKLMKEGKWEEAAVEAANSRWNEQTPVRVQDLQNALRSLG